MTVSDSTNKLIVDYHDASGRLAAFRRSQQPYTDEQRETYSCLVSENRELMTRCLLSDDPRSLMFLLEQMAIVLKIVGQPRAANVLEGVVSYLMIYYDQHGTL